MSLKLYLLSKHMKTNLKKMEIEILQHFLVEISWSHTVAVDEPYW